MIILTVTVGCETYIVLAIPASNIGSIIEPGGLAIGCDYYIFHDGPNTNVTLAKDCDTSAILYKETTTTAILNDVLGAICTSPAPNPLPPGGIGQGAQFRIEFGTGAFFITSTITINCPNNAGNGSGNAMTWWGQGEDKTTLILAKGVNGDMFSVTSIGDKFELHDIKFFGTKSGQSGTSYAFNFQTTDTGGEYIWSHNEFRDWLTGGVRFAQSGKQWNVFIDNWFLTSPIGVDYENKQNDIRFVGNKFGTGVDVAGAGMIGIKFASNDNPTNDNGRVVISANIFDDAGILFNSNATRTVAITGNIFVHAPTKTIDYEGIGLTALGNQNAIISSNLFSAKVNTNVAVYLADYVDAVTVTANQFANYTSSTTVPVTLIQTHQKLSTLVTQNSGMGSFWTGFGISQPAVPATGVDQQNTNPFQARIYITGTGTGITAYKITDPSGTSNTFTTTVSIGFTIELDPYAKVALTFTGAPTWKWYGEANLS